MEEKIIELKNLTKCYDQFTAVDQLNLSVSKGEIFGLLGPNGAGKSTLFRTLAGLLQVCSGTIRFDSTQIERKPSHVRVERGLILVPEGRLIFPDMSVEENIRVGSVNSRARGDWRSKAGSVYELFPRLKERRAQLGGTLSGGEQQMLAVGRAFISARKLMLLDEPSMGLAPLLMLNVFNALKQINKEGTAILLVEQNARMALQFSQRGYVLETGNIIIEGKSEYLLNSPDVKKAYLGA